MPGLHIALEQGEMFRVGGWWHEFGDQVLLMPPDTPHGSAVVKALGIDSYRYARVAGLTGGPVGEVVRSAETGSGKIGVKASQIQGVWGVRSMSVCLSDPPFLPEGLDPAAWLARVNAARLRCDLPPLEAEEAPPPPTGDWQEENRAKAAETQNDYLSDDWLNVTEEDPCQLVSGSTPSTQTVDSCNQNNSRQL